MFSQCYRLLKVISPPFFPPFGRITYFLKEIYHSPTRCGQMITISHIFFPLSEPKPRYNAVPICTEGFVEKPRTSFCG